MNTICRGVLMLAASLLLASAVQVSAVAQPTQVSDRPQLEQVQPRLTVRSAGRQFVSAIRERNPRAAARVARPRVVRQALKVTRGADRVGFQGCIRRNSPWWPTFVDTNANRMCVLTRETDGFGSGYGLFMRQAGGRTSKIYQFEGIAG